MTELTERIYDKTSDQLDDMLADSFPASDPPSTTPISRVGTPAPVEPEPRRNRFWPALIVLGALCAGGLAIGVLRARRQLR